MMRNILIAALSLLIVAACHNSSAPVAASLLSDEAAPAAPLDVQTGQAALFPVTLDNDQLVAVHPSWPFGTVVRVTNIQNGRSVMVRIIDRAAAPLDQKEGVVIGLSRAAARRLGLGGNGTDGAIVSLEVARWGNART